MKRDEHELYSELSMLYPTRPADQHTLQHKQTMRGRNDIVQPTVKPKSMSNLSSHYMYVLVMFMYRGGSHGHWH